MDLSSTLMFIEVARHGSFTQAARALTISKSHLSSRISQLEKELGVALMTRTTRKLSLTEAGEQYFRKCLPALNELKTAREEASQGQAVPTGWIRITVPLDFSESTLPDFVAEYLDIYPNVKVEICYSDRFVDLVAENFDLAIRAGTLKDSTLIAKKIGVSNLILIATPKYLKSKSPIRSLKDLAAHSCIVYGEAEEEVWELQGPSGKSRVRIKARAKLNNFLAIKRLVLAHQGVGLVPRFICEPELSQGQLVSPLPGFRTSSEPVHLVYPASRALSPKLKALLPILEKATKRLTRT
jgi:DNA-binding transcriptional LysR family regulator